MREIKFRAFDFKEKKMVDVTSLSWTKHLGLAVNFGPFHGNPMDAVRERYHAMQFTGLLDKNGKEIYEGDIVRPEGEVKGFEVEWSNQNSCHGYVVVSSSDGDMYQFSELATRISEDNLRCEVIGNIYENSDLIK